MHTYKRTLVDRLGPEGSAIIRSAVLGVVFSPLGAIIGAVAGGKLGLSTRGMGWLTIAGAVLGGLFVYFVMRAIPYLGGAALQATLMPSGNTTPYETDFSYESALVMKGDVKMALASFEEKIAAQPLDSTVRLKAAEVYLGAGNFERARELYREVQRIPGVAGRDDVIASYRLIDLYRGKLADPGRSLPEFRRLIERYPDSQIERQAREALSNLKKEMSFEP